MLCLGGYECGSWLCVLHSDVIGEGFGAWGVFWKFFFLLVVFLAFWVEVGFPYVHLARAPEAVGFVGAWVVFRSSFW